MWKFSKVYILATPSGPTRTWHGSVRMKVHSLQHISKVTVESYNGEMEQHGGLKQHGAVEQHGGGEQCRGVEQHISVEQHR